jgi:putative ABC transport system permease protein
LAVVLLAGAGAMIHSFLNVYTADVGAGIANIRNVFVHLPEERYSNHEKQVAFFDNLKTRLAALPGVESVALGNAPASGIARPRPYQLAGDDALNEERRPRVAMQTVGTDYFRTLSATVSGREFNTFDTGSSAPVVIVNRRFADEHWPGQSAIGQRLRVFESRALEPWRTVVGVVSNVIYDPGRQEVTPMVYLPYAQRSNESDMWILVRTRLPAAELAAPLRHEISVLDPGMPIWLGPYDLPERLAASGPYRELRQHTILLSIFACIALLLASAGVYAVISHSVSQRTREIGIRMAVGATRVDIFRLVFKVVMSPLVLGLIIGLAGAVAVNRILSAEFVRVSSTDPSSFTASCALLFLSAVCGCWIPARRAMRVDPMVALRNE